MFFGSRAKVLKQKRGTEFEARFPIIGHGHFLEASYERESELHTYFNKKRRFTPSSECQCSAVRPNSQPRVTSRWCGGGVVVVVVVVVKQ